MTPSAMSRALAFTFSLKTSRSIVLVAAVLAASSMARADIARSNADFAANQPTTQTQPSSARQFPQQLAEHVITFDNSKGTEKLEFREILRQRRCVATVTPDFFTIAPGETAQIRMDVRDNQPSGCLGEPKHVLLSVASAETEHRPLSYMVLFSVEPKMDDAGRVRIASTRSSKPGAPYAATCGDHRCLNDWVPLSGNDNTVVLYRRD